MRNRLVPLALLTLVGLAFSLLGCDSADNPIAPSGSVLTITANPTQISLAGETSTLTVTGFRPDGNSLNPGTQINLSTTLGVLGQTIVEIADGRATTTLRADGLTGTATVTASLPGATDVTATVDVTIGETDQSRPSLVLNANPTIIPVGGRSEISVLARTSDGSLLGQGNRIRVTSDFGRMVDVDASCGNFSPTITEVITDSNGEAFASYCAGERSGTGEVAAILGTSAEEMVQIQINAALDSLSLSSDVQNIQRNDAGEQIELTAVLLDSLGGPVRALVRFESEAGSFSNDAVTSDSNGIARSTLTVERIDVQSVPENGTFRITATAISEGETRSDFVDIQVLGPP